MGQVERQPCFEREHGGWFCGVLAFGVRSKRVFDHRAMDLGVGCRFHRKGDRVHNDALALAGGLYVDRVVDPQTLVEIHCEREGGEVEGVEVVVLATKQLAVQHIPHGLLLRFRFASRGAELDEEGLPLDGHGQDNQPPGRAISSGETDAARAWGERRLVEEVAQLVLEPSVGFEDGDRVDMRRWHAEKVLVELPHWERLLARRRHREQSTGVPSSSSGAE